MPHPVEKGLIYYEDIDIRSLRKRSREIVRAETETNLRAANHSNVSVTHAQLFNKVAAKAFPGFPLFGEARPALPLADLR